jgi:hypothetical protein
MRYSLLALATATLAMTGCAGFQANTLSTPGHITMSAIKGNVHGGQSPISGATIQVYQAGTTGTYGTGAVALIPTTTPQYYLGGANGCVASGTQTCYSTVISDANGNFSITGDYTCSAGTELYLTSTGGNPGSGVNNASVLMSAIGLCDNLANVPFVQINEVTTVGTVYSLAQFMSDSYVASSQAGFINIGAPASNVAGMKLAFADVNTLVDYAQGITPGPALGSGATIPAGTVVPSQEVFALADSMASCVNTNGGSGGSCSTLFADTTVGSAVPGDTAAAILSMAIHPANNAAAILALKSPSAPWTTNFITANDLTLPITYSAGSITAPTAMAIDASGNVWVTDSTTAQVTEIGHTGIPSANTPYTVGTTPSAIALDSVGHVWVANSGSNSLTELSNAGTSLATVTSGVSAPSSLAFDAAGDIWVANYGNSTATEYSSTGTPVATAALPSAVGLVIATQ